MVTFLDVSLKFSIRLASKMRQIDNKYSVTHTNTAEAKTKKQIIIFLMFYNVKEKYNKSN